MMLFKILKYCGNKVKAMENEIWVGTFREVVAYTKEREKNRLNVLENGYNITPSFGYECTIIYRTTDYGIEICGKQSFGD